ncbi:hypothetical protein NLJ89_g3794 [Agrocybe chaxingu]|uniref:Uncharacterized protein n=1 Tax=Agrocybe chaxingu TaxID=84603 RepID=A0A9W8K3B0_9AGAR|nr:hypothetical protein NLJ89_g3794 [Agrocybe chaxingu]
MGRQMIRPLESFQRMEFTVPQKVKDLEPWDWDVSFDSCAIANDCIDFSGATNPREFSWNGDFCLLASKCVNLPLYNLKILKISGCFISVEEAISILHSCLNLTCAELGTVDNSVQRTTKTNIRISTSPRVQLRFLTDLTIVTNEQLESILQRIAWRNLSSLTLIIGGTGLVGIPNTISSLQNLGRLKLTLAGRVEDREYAKIRRLMQNYEEEY